MLLLLGGSESVQEFLRWRHLLLQIGTCVLRDIDLDCVPVAIVATEVHSQIQVLGRGLLLLDRVRMLLGGLGWGVTEWDLVVLERRLQTISTPELLVAIRIHVVVIC
jgi:hypothetical protein